MCSSSEGSTGRGQGVRRNSGPPILFGSYNIRNRQNRGLDPALVCHGRISTLGSSGIQISRGDLRKGVEQVSGCGNRGADHASQGRCGILPQSRAIHYVGALLPCTKRH